MNSDGICPCAISISVLHWLQLNLIVCQRLWFTPSYPTTTSHSLTDSHMASPLGTCFIGALSIEKCIQDLFDGPLPDLTDNESGNEDAASSVVLPTGGQSCPAQCTASEPSHDRKQRERKKRKRNKTRARMQEQEGGFVKQVVKKRKLEAATNTIQVKEFSIEHCPNVTLPAWVGKRQNFPQQIYTKDQLLKDYGMRNIEWDGRRVKQQIIM